MNEVCKNINSIGLVSTLLQSSVVAKLPTITTWNDVSVELTKTPGAAILYQVEGLMFAKGKSP